MTRLATSERAALCDTALAVGADRPTLSGEWTVKDLVVHLLLREGSPAAVGIVVAPLSRLADAASARIGRRSWPELVQRLRSGPPRLSPFAIPKIDELGNSLEFFVHHEDIRRAQQDWSPRDLGAETERTLWSSIGMPGKALTRKAPVGVRIENTTTGESRVLKKAAETVTVQGPPAEVVLFLFGRSAQARVELLGDPDAVARLQATSLSI
jgi:uncharacterized protein (TIGR03085 family)